MACLLVLTSSRREFHVLAWRPCRSLQVCLLPRHILLLLYASPPLLLSPAHPEAPASTSKPATFGGWCNAIGTTRARHLILIIFKWWSYINSGLGNMTANIRAGMIIISITIINHLLWLTGIGQHPLVSLGTMPSESSYHLTFDRRKPFWFGFGFE